MPFAAPFGYGLRPRNATKASVGVASGPTGTAAVNGNDGNNNVIWLGGTSWRYGSGTLGLTTSTFSSGLLLDADMELNNNSRWGTNGGASDTDLQSVVAHEAGHFVGIAHTTTGNAIMNPSIGSGVLKRNLFAGDLSDICGIYPGTAGVIKENTRNGTTFHCTHCHTKRCQHYNNKKQINVTFSRI